jgi:hypothetical protein
MRITKSRLKRIIAEEHGKYEIDRICYLPTQYRDFVSRELTKYISGEYVLMEQTPSLEQQFDYVKELDRDIQDVVDWLNRFRVEIDGLRSGESDSPRADTPDNMDRPDAITPDMMKGQGNYGQQAGSGDDKGDKGDKDGKKTYLDPSSPDFPEKVKEIEKNLEKGQKEIKVVEGDVQKIFENPELGADAVMKSLEDYLGMRKENWYDDNGDMKDEVRQKLEELQGEAGPMAQQVQDLARSKKPIHKKVQGAANLFKFGGIGTALLSTYQLFTNTELVRSTVGAFGEAGDLFYSAGFEVPTGVEFGGVTAMKIALALGGAYLLTQGVAWLLKNSKEAGVTDKFSKAFGPITKKAKDITGTLFSGVSTFVSNAYKKIKSFLPGGKPRMAESLIDPKMYREIQEINLFFESIYYFESNLNNILLEANK